MNKQFGLGLVSLVALASGCTLSKGEAVSGSGGGDTGGSGGTPTIDCDADNDGHTVMYEAQCGGVGDNADCNDLDSNINPDAAEICGDGFDNNCNGLIDEDCGCQSGATQACYAGSTSTRNVGTCHDGVQTCSSGSWGACLGSVTPVSEVCGNATDENCNGQVNEGCGNGLTDADGDGYYGNDPDHSKLDCNDSNPAVHPGAVELCNNTDDNCVNGVDEDNPGGGDYCNTAQLGVCAAGTKTCQNGGIVCMPNVTPSAEVCDSLDNNCDGQVDEGNVCNSGGTPVTVCFHLTPPVGTNLNIAQMNWWAPTEDDCIMTVFDGQDHVACPATYYSGTLVVFSPDAMADGIFYHPFDTCGAPPGTQAIGSVWVTKGECADNGPSVWNQVSGSWVDNPDNLACTRNGTFVAPNP